VRSVTLGEAKKQYVQGLVTKGKAKITVQVYRSIVEKMIASFKEDKTVDKIIVPHVHQIFKTVDESGQSEASIKRNKRVFCQFMYFSMEQGWINYFPIPNVVKKSFRGGKYQVRSLEVVDSNANDVTMISKIKVG